MPEDKVGQDAFAVIREAMKRTNMVGLGRIVILRRERIVMLEPFDKGLMATTLRYAYEVRDAAARSKAAEGKKPAKEPERRPAQGARKAG